MKPLAILVLVLGLSSLTRADGLTYWSTAPNPISYKLVQIQRFNSASAKFQALEAQINALRAERGLGPIAVWMPYEDDLAMSALKMEEMVAYCQRQLDGLQHK